MYPAAGARAYSRGQAILPGHNPPAQAQPALYRLNPAKHFFLSDSRPAFQRQNLLETSQSFMNQQGCHNANGKGCGGNAQHYCYPDSFPNSLLHKALLKIGRAFRAKRSKRAFAGSSQA
jgi:hypothetical protein